MWTFSDVRGFRFQVSGFRPKLCPGESRAPRAHGTQFAALRALASSSAFLTAWCLLALEPETWNLKPALAAAGLYQVLEIKPDVFVWLPDDVLDQEGDPDFARAGTAGFIIRPDGVVVVDTTNSPFHARELVYEIRRRTDQPVKYVIDTDPEGDHALGNEVFVDQQASIVATPGTQAGLRNYQLQLPRRLDADSRLQGRMRG